MIQNMTDVPANVVWLYFYGDPDGEILKFGYSSDHPEVRKAQHERRGPSDVKMQFLAGVLGHPADEGYLINYWRDYRLSNRREWIHAKEPVRSWLRWFRDQPFVATSIEALDSLSFVDSGEWLPTSERTKDLQLQLFGTLNPWADLNTSEIMEGDYYTDLRITAAARTAMGGIDLDPASCREANEGVHASRFFGIFEDGLSKQWHGRVWLNPPFGRWDVWVPKALNEYNDGAVDQMCIFSTVNTSISQRFHPIVAAANAIWLPNGRFSCWGPKSSNAMEGCIVCYLGDRVDAFRSAFQNMGRVVT